MTWDEASTDGYFARLREFRFLTFGLLNWRIIYFFRAWYGL